MLLILKFGSNCEKGWNCRLIEIINYLMEKINIFGLEGFKAEQYGL